MDVSRPDRLPFYEGHIYPPLTSCVSVSFFLTCDNLLPLAPFPILIIKELILYPSDTMVADKVVTSLSTCLSFRVFMTVSPNDIRQKHYKMQDTEGTLTRGHFHFTHGFLLRHAIKKRLVAKRATILNTQPFLR